MYYTKPCMVEDLISFAKLIIDVISGNMANDKVNKKTEQVAQADAVNGSR